MDGAFAARGGRAFGAAWLAGLIGALSLGLAACATQATPIAKPPAPIPARVIPCPVPGPAGKCGQLPVAAGPPTGPGATAAATAPGPAAVPGVSGPGSITGPGAVPTGPAPSAVSPLAPSSTASAVRQLITVTAPSYGATYATLRAYQVSGTKRVPAFGPWTARVGYNGVARPGAKREGDGKTPSGTYGFGFFFGVLANPGVAYPFRHAYSYDYWDDDPASPRYNLWVDARTANPGVRPEPMHQVPAYDYAAVIAYNTARVPGLGSAIFLHVGTGGPTAGCVSLPYAELVKLLRWLKPAAIPRITITAL